MPSPLTTGPVTICLPTADRRRAFTFFTEGLGLETVGPIADDGVPEPLQVVVTDNVLVMLIPSDGFGWTIGSHTVAQPGTAEVVLSIGVATPADVGALVERARAAGAEVVVAAGAQPWGYTGTFADPDGHLWSVLAAPGD